MLFVLCVFLSVLFIEDVILDDWNNLKNAGFGVGKRSKQNLRIAQWVASKFKFQGGVYNSIFNGEDYSDRKSKVDMMTWACLCAKHGKQASSVCQYVLVNVCL